MGETTRIEAMLQENSMKITIEIFKTEERPPVEKDSYGGEVMAYNREIRRWYAFDWFYVKDSPVDFPLWFSLRGLPKPPPLRKRSRKPLAEE